MALESDGNVVGVARVSALTSGTPGSTTQDITDSNMGVTPNAVRLFVCLADTNNTRYDGASIAWGMSDGTDEGCIAIWAEDNVGTTNAGRLTRDRLIHLPDDTGTVIMSLTTDSFISNGVRVTYETIPTDAHFIMAVFYKADNVKVGVTVGDTTAGNKVDITSPGFQPNVIWGYACGLNVTSSDTTGTHGIMSAGLYVDNGASATQRYDCAIWMSGNTTSSCGHATKEGEFTSSGFPSGSTVTVTANLKVVDVDSSGFSLETVNLSNTCLWMALEFSEAVDLVIFNTGNTTGDVSSTEPGFGPQSIEAVLSEQNRTVSSVVTEASGPWGFYAGTEHAEFTTSACQRDNRSGGETGSLSDDQCHLLRRNLNTSGGMIAEGPAGTGSLNDDGFTFDFSSEIGGPKDWTILVIQERPQVVSVTADTLEVAEQDSEPFTPVELGLQTAEVGEQEPDVIPVVDVGVQTSEVEEQSVSPFTPVETGLVTVEVDDQASSPFTPVELGLEAVEVEEQTVSPFTPVETGLGTLEVEEQDAGVPTVVDVAQQTTELEEKTADAVTPVSMALVAIELESQVPEVISPVTVAVSTAEVEEQTVTVFTPVELSLQTTEVEEQTPSVTTGTAVFVGLETLELSDQSISPFTPVEVGLETLNLSDQGIGPVIPVEVGSNTVEVASLSPTVFTPVSVALQALEVAGLVPAISAVAVGCFKRVRNTVMSKLYNDFTDAHSYDTVYENFLQSIDTESVWAHAALFFDTSKEVMTGTSNILFRKIGRMIVSVYAPIEEGINDLYTAADRITASFRNVIDASVRFKGVSVLQRGRVGKYWQIDVVVPFVSDTSVAKQTGDGDSTSVSFDAIHDACNTRMKTLVADAQSVEVAYDNFPFEDPGDTTWVRFTVQMGESILVSSGGTGSNRYRTPGQAVATVFHPIEHGIDDSYTLVDQIADVFRAVTSDGVTYQTPNVVTVGRSGKFWQTNVEIPFYADTIG